MRIFVSDVRELYARGVSGSEAVRALLRYGAELCWGEAVPNLEKSHSGRPFFPGQSHKHLSLSHSKSHVLVALSDHAVGADVETLRPVRGRAEKLFSPEMLRDFGYYGGWTLRESLFKLMGEGSLRSMELRREKGEIVGPFENVRCRLYEDVPGCVFSVACVSGEFPEAAELVDPQDFWA